MDYCRTIGVPPGFRSRLAWLDTQEVANKTHSAYPDMVNNHWFASRQHRDTPIGDTVGPA